MPPQLHGFHHLTAVTADARANLAFYTQSLGLRLVKKTVNQDDVSAYHLFYADGLGSPGTDITFFDWPLTRHHSGTRSITRTGLRVADLESLRYWHQRFTDLGVPHGDILDRDNRPTLDFEDPEGQRLSLTIDDSSIPSHPWPKSPISPQHQIRGLGPITISVPDLSPTDALLTGLMQMHHARQYGAGPSVHVYEMPPAGPAAELHVAVEAGLPNARVGAGGVHHVAFRIPTFEQYDQWIERLAQHNIRSSGPVDRFYFKSLYFREPSGILFELATDGPGFHADEPVAELGRRLSLPPFLESRRGEIEANLKPL